MRPLLATLLAFLALLPAAAAAQAPPPPAATTGPAEAIGPTSATLTGTVNPGGTATDAHFEYGTTTAYGSVTGPSAVGDGSDDVPVRALLEGLEPSTTYHFRLVAGAAVGADATFRTIATPTITRLAAAEKTSTSARLTARINPNRSATTFHMEWGTSAGLGNRTADQTLPAGRRGVAVAAVLDGLPSYRRIYWRVVAENAAGVKRSGTASFITLRALTGAAFGVSPSITTWGGAVALSGRVEGAGVNGIPVALEEEAFPFGAGFREVATTTTNQVGRFRFAPRAVFLATRFRAVTRNALVVASAAATVQVRPRVGIAARRRTPRSLRLAGDVNPGLPVGHAVLQRRTRHGRWVGVVGAPLRAHDAERSSYGFFVRRLRRAAAYRVKVQAFDGGAHATGYSRSVLVGKKTARKGRRKARPRQRSGTSRIAPSGGSVISAE